MQSDIKQWGYVSTNTYPQKVSYPISFPNSVFSIHVTPVYGGGYTPSGYVWGSVTTSEAKLNAQRWSNASYHSELGTYYWTAIGVQQWRDSVAAKATFTYPITFSVVYAILLTSTGNNWCWASTITTSSAYNDNKSPSCFLGIGKQQWGQCYGYKSSKLTNFPISFTTTKFIEIAGTTYMSELLGMPVCSLRFDDSLTTIRTGANNGSTSTIGVGTYVVLGMQQWGQATRNNLTTFPVAFTAIYGAVATQTGSYSGAYALVSSILSTTQVKFESNKVDNIRYLAYGKQQWGYKNENFSSANQTFTFPVAFNTVYAVALGGGNSNSYTTNDWIASGQLKVYSVSITKLVIQYSGPKYFIAIGE